MLQTPCGWPERTTKRPRRCEKGRPSQAATATLSQEVLIPPHVIATGMLRQQRLHTRAGTSRMPQTSPTCPPAFITQSQHLCGCVTPQRLTQAGNAMLHCASPVAVVQAAVRGKYAAPWQHRARVSGVARLSVVLHERLASCIAGQEGHHRLPGWQDTLGSPLCCKRTRHIQCSHPFAHQACSGNAPQTYTQHRHANTSGPTQPAVSVRPRASSTVCRVVPSTP
jgi:hypothetical protein